MELQPAACVENKTKAVVPNKIGECKIWFLGPSFKQGRAGHTSCRGQTPVGPRNVSAGGSLCTFPSLVESPSPAPVCQVHVESAGFPPCSSNPGAGASWLLAHAAFQGA